MTAIVDPQPVNRAAVNRIRLLILILGPLPILGSSWALCAWFKSEPPPIVAPNRVLGVQADRAAPEITTATPAPQPSPLSGRALETGRQLEAMLGSECQVVVRSPFVLGSDLSRAEVEQLYDRTMAPAVLAMYRTYFATPPSDPITVLLFRNEDSYNRYCEELFGERGISIYGYYKPRRRTLVLNIGTGSGTLLHELTHALADFDFPDLPDWLNEGLASLHEQSRFGSRGGEPWIEGLVNWRLAGLQEVVRDGRLDSLAEMMANPRFRGPGEGTNYAQARYFCLYMQQQGLLAEYYRAFRRDHAHDPYGQKTLAAVLPGVDLDQFDRDFQQWVLALGQGD
ncbi:MAG: hypothetical protein DWQ37_10095 [Planctomycetota bacterium]|nr:MAG: hypothetical protein DWQ37_10095 [Planctomycetota bacterium]